MTLKVSKADSRDIGEFEFPARLGADELLEQPRVFDQINGGICSLDTLFLWTLLESGGNSRTGFDGC
jgi:hypothetical protein